ncbi:MAG: 2-oxoglutarate oxidoreductase, partial [Phycisphaerae bacterium]|nr:2-oxoglutarate oxidoreductase [Phycisphaerae bacterium]
RPDKIIFSYQGDGDLASIGVGEIIQGAHRGERITVIFFNNALFGMTGGQMAPTTVSHQVTQTTPQGRDPATEGFPMQVSEMLALLPGTVYIERCSLHDAAHILKTKKAIKHAFELQVQNAPGLTMVEVLSACPTYWRMKPADAMKWIKEKMTESFPLGRIKG